MATPALRAIRNRFRDSRITFLMEPNLRELVCSGDWMDECIEWPDKPRRSLLTAEFRRFIKRLRTSQFDCAILFPNSFRSALTVWAARIPRRVGYHRDGRGWLLTDRIPVRNRRRSIYHIHGRRADGGNGRIEKGASLPPIDEGKNVSPLNKGEQKNASPLYKGGQRGVGGVHLDAPQNEDSPNPIALGSPSLQANRVESLTAALRWYGAECDCATKHFGPHAPVIVGRHLPRSPGVFIPMPMVHYYADLVEAIRCERPGDVLELFTTLEDDDAVETRLHAMSIADKRPLIVLSPGAKFGASKCWPPDRFASAANQLNDVENAAVVITCGPGEEPIAREIKRGIPINGHALDNPLLSLGQLKSLIRRCDLLICNDAGPRHFAKAFGVPVVTIFGPTHPDWTATSYENERIVRVDIECGPCQQRVCPLRHHRCMTDVTVDMVVEAARELLASRRTAGIAR